MGTNLYDPLTMGELQRWKRRDAGRGEVDSAGHDLAGSRSAMKLLSSHQTIFVKFVVPGIWTAVVGLAVLASFIGGDDARPDGKWLVLGAWVVGASMFFWSGSKLKEVSVDGRFLYVSNYRDEIVIPLSDIYDVTESFWTNTHPITIHLKSRSQFGDKIVFIPKTRMFAFFSSHPVVKELKQLARASRPD